MGMGRWGGVGCCDAINNQVITVSRPLMRVASLLPFAWQRWEKDGGYGWQQLSGARLDT